MNEISAALRAFVDQVKRDAINNAVLPAIGAGILFSLWYYGWVSWSVIHAFLCHDLC